MVGSPAVGAWIAYIAFVMLLCWGVASGELGRRSIAIALSACIAAYIGVSFIPYGETLLVTAVAVIDIILVLTIFKRDVRL